MWVRLLPASKIDRQSLISAAIVTVPLAREVVTSQLAVEYEGGPLALRPVAMATTREGPMTIFGYARVSTGSQDYQSQVDKLRSAGANKTYREKISGARSDRPELRRLIRSLQAGDVMMVTAIDRAARNTRDLLNILDEVSRAEAKFKSLSEPWCNSTSPRVS